MSSPADPDFERRLAQSVQAIEAILSPAAVVLFGSHAGGTVGRFSDVDLAVLLGHPGSDAEELAGLRVELEAVLGSPVDLAVLDQASPILAMEVLRHHQILACRDRQAFEDFTVRTLTDYFDLKRTRRPIEQALLAPRSS